MPYSTNWNLSRYFYSGLDDPRLATDIASVTLDTEAFAAKYRDTFAKLTKPEEILEFYQDYTDFSYRLGKP